VGTTPHGRGYGLYSAAMNRAFAGLNVDPSTLITPRTTDGLQLGCATGTTQPDSPYDSLAPPVAACVWKAYSPDYGTVIVSHTSDVNVAMQDATTLEQSVKIS
jgi:hypothetical protein